MSLYVYPTGTTVYKPERCWSGYTLLPTTLRGSKAEGALLVDMNGNMVNQWKRLNGELNKMLPGGYIMGDIPLREDIRDMKNLVQLDWNGNIVWQFKAREHHDYQREGNPVGYYVPGLDPLVDKGNTLILTHKNIKNTQISENLLIDDTIIEVTWDGKIVWEWVCSEHFNELGFNEDARYAIAHNTHAFAGLEAPEGMD